MVCQRTVTPYRGGWNPAKLWGNLATIPSDYRHSPSVAVYVASITMAPALRRSIGGSNVGPRILATGIVQIPSQRLPAFGTRLENTFLG